MTEPTPKLFTEELEAYAQRKEELLALCEGKFALFKGVEYCGTFDSASAAYDAGIDRFGNVPFLVQHVERAPAAVRFPALDLGVLHVHL